MFRGINPPSLKLGEWASDGHYAYLGMEHGEYKVFQGVFDMGKDQGIAGFEYDVNQRAITIPCGTPFSRLQILFDSLPKALKYSTGSQASLDILFEDGTFINDLGTFLVLRDFSYQINIKSLTNQVNETTASCEKPVVFQSDKAIEVYNSAVNFSDIRFEYEDEQNGAISFLNCSTYINDCSFESKKGGVCVSDKGYNRIVFSECYFQMFGKEQFSILDKAAVGSFINIARSKSDAENNPRSVALWLYGGMIIVGNVSGLNLGGKSQFDANFGGVEIHNGFVTDVDGSVDVDIPKKLSDLENDMRLTRDYQQLDNTPTTISEEQAEAIENNTAKQSYPNSDKDKLAAIGDEATKGADWNINVKNKPGKLSHFENDLPLKKLADFDPDDDQTPATCKAVANWNTGSEALTSSRIDWNGKPILIAELTGDITLSTTNLIANKKITIIASGNYEIRYPSYFKELASSGTYDGTKSNLVEMVCTNAEDNNKEVWYTITPEM